MATEERTREILKELHNAVTNFEENDAVKWAKITLEEGLDPFVATMDGLADGMIEAGEKYNRKEYFVPELLMCADALYAGLGLLKPAIEASGRKSEVKGSIVLGVVEGDVHDSSEISIDKLSGLGILFIPAYGHTNIARGFLVHRHLFPTIYAKSHKVGQYL